MSEKPFWEGKTGKEMAGLHVKVTWKNGTIVTGVLDDIGDIDLGDNRSLYMSRGYASYCDFEPMDNIQSIELLDDPEYERIDDIKDVREGDIFVANDGNKYPIDAVDTYRAFGRSGLIFPTLGLFGSAIVPSPTLCVRSRSRSCPTMTDCGLTRTVTRGRCATAACSARASVTITGVSPARGSHRIAFRCWLRLRSVRPRRWKHEHHQQ